ncbi:putative lipoprotein [Flavobacterium daejeonense]|nr:putative lipoprotein [Flavobacterium daejeonense]
MKKQLPLLALFFFILSCGVKQTRNLLTSGNYDEAIDNAINNLRSNKDKKGNQEYVYLLEEAFYKAKERDLNQLNLLEQDKNPVNLERIYNTYIQLNNRQEKIKPLLPLRLLKEGKNAKFSFDNYNKQIVDSKNALSEYLYENSKALLKSTNKLDFRKAYDDLEYLNQINPNFQNTLQLQEEALNKGKYYVNVVLRNQTNMLIPMDLQNDLLDFNTYGMNDKWTVYHSTLQKQIKYDYQIIVNFRDIVISPEQIKEKEFVKEKQIKDGLKDLLDKNGKQVKDSLGKVIKVDNLTKIVIRIREYNQYKACQITANVDYIDYKNKQLVQSFPLTSESIFKNDYATYKGDKRATEESYYPYFSRKLLPFPSNEQMVYNTGEDLKAKLKGILTRNRF